MSTEEISKKKQESIEGNEICMYEHRPKEEFDHVLS